MAMTGTSAPFARTPNDLIAPTLGFNTNSWRLSGLKAASVARHVGYRSTAAFRRRYNRSTMRQNDGT
jgi:homoserine acetyltransferase